MDGFQLQKLRDLPIEGVAERLGLHVSRHKCLCPFHDDHHASMSFKVNKNTFRCFVCGASGGTIDLAMNLLKSSGRGSFREACRWLADENNVILTEYTSSSLTSNPSTLTELSDSILQAARVKFTKTEYISCPGCGRTLYDLQGTIARIKAAIKAKSAENPRFATLKIGIMGCIVNGPGEMADADYGYVGAGPGKISLYKNKVCVEKSIPEANAVEKLIEFIENDAPQPPKGEHSI